MRGRGWFTLGIGEHDDGSGPDAQHHLPCRGRGCLGLCHDLTGDNQTERQNGAEEGTRLHRAQYRPFARQVKCTFAPLPGAAVRDIDHVEIPPPRDRPVMNPTPWPRRRHARRGPGALSLVWLMTCPEQKAPRCREAQIYIHSSILRQEAAAALAISFLIFSAWADRSVSLALARNASRPPR